VTNDGGHSAPWKEPGHMIMHELKTLEQGPLVGGLFLARVARAGGYG